jgi:hypothetical protein
MSLHRQNSVVKNGDFLAPFKRGLFVRGCNAAFAIPDSFSVAGVGPGPDFKEVGYSFDRVEADVPRCNVINPGQAEAVRTMARVDGLYGPAIFVQVLGTGQPFMMGLDALQKDVLDCDFKSLVQFSLPVNSADGKTAENSNDRQGYKRDFHAGQYGTVNRILQGF